jgi:hypothetical protein
MLSFYLVIAVSVCTRAASSPEVVFQSACDVHSPRNRSLDGSNIYKGSLPELPSPGWLYASETDIAKWYEIGMAECNAFLISNSSSMGTNFPPTYMIAKDIPSVGQIKCRGIDMLFALTGIIVWPFGPMESCPTYSKCWFGLLTCGTPKKEALSEMGRKNIVKALQKVKPNAPLPSVSDWSIKALSIHLRVIGLEIIAPEQRLVSVAPGSSNQHKDVIIAQYVITIPYDEYKLEMRIAEIYPSALYQWDRDDIVDNGMLIFGNIYLGGSESRCNWGRCQHKNVCCGCDEKSFLTGTPRRLVSKSGLALCPNVQKLREAAENENANHVKKGQTDGSNEGQPLPLCSKMDSTSPGRWILSSKTRQGSSSTTPLPFCHYDYVTAEFNEVPKTIKVFNPLSINKVLLPVRNVSDEHSQRHHHNSWFEASGDPCIVQHTELEDNLERSWFFAPYECRYHFYTKPELHQCLKSQSISHIHFHGDSMSRELFLYVSRYLGVPSVTEEELKHMTNVMKKNNIQIASDGIVVSEGKNNLTFILFYFILFWNFKRLVKDNRGVFTSSNIYLFTLERLISS